MMRLPAMVYVATEPVNLHFSFDRLAGIVREQLGGDPRSEALFVFHNRRRTHAKILWHDGRGYWLLYKRLDRGTYRIPLAIPPGAPSVNSTTWIGGAARGRYEATRKVFPAWSCRRFRAAIPVTPLMRRWGWFPLVHGRQGTIFVPWTQGPVSSRT